MYGCGPVLAARFSCPDLVDLLLGLGNLAGLDVLDLLLRDRVPLWLLHVVDVDDRVLGLLRVVVVCDRVLLGPIPLVIPELVVLAVVAQVLVEVVPGALIPVTAVKLIDFFVQFFKKSGGVRAIPHFLPNFQQNLILEKTKFLIEPLGRNIAFKYK